MIRQKRHSRSEQIAAFFARSDLLDHVVLRPLSHIHLNWEITWDLASGRYETESDSFAESLNTLIDELAHAKPPKRYHDNEDRLAEYVRDGHLKWPIQKFGNRWVGQDYDLILQQGSFDDIDQQNLVLAAAGRVHAAIDRGQSEFDQMEDSHRQTLGAVLSIIIWQRYVP